MSIAAVVVGATTAVALGLPRDEMHTNCGGDSTDRSIAAARGSSCQAVWDLINAGPRDWPSGRVIRLRVVQVKTPALPVPGYVTRGTYPHVRAAGRDLSAANDGLRAAVLEQEGAFAAIARQEEKAVPVDPSDPGQFQTSPRRSLTSASNVVVSALIPAVERFPGGNDGGEWLSAAVRVASGSRVTILDLFSSPSAGLAELARLTRKYGVARNRCVAYAIHGEFGSTFRRRFAPTPHHYRNFALLPNGLAVGFGTGQVALPVCGRIVVIVPYTGLRPYLSELGQKLIAGARPKAVGLRTHRRCDTRHEPSCTAIAHSAPVHG